MATVACRKTGVIVSGLTGVFPGFFGNFPLALKNTFRLLKFVLQILQFQKVGKFKKWHCQVSFSHFRIDKNFYYFASVHLYSVKIMMGFQFNLNAKRKISRRKKVKEDWQLRNSALYTKKSRWSNNRAGTNKREATK